MKLFAANHRLALAAVCLVYISLRLWNLTDSCLWFDEIFGVHAAEMDWRNLFWFVARDLIHPPLFYVLLKIWLSIGGESLLWLRLFPVLFSVLAVFPFLKLCGELNLNFDSRRKFRTISLALLFFAVNGSLIKYAQEVRMYSLLLCAAVFSLWLFARFVNTGERFPALLVVNLLLVYTHYFGWFIVAAEILAIIVLAGHHLKKIWAMFGFVFLGFTPWIYLVWQASKINADVGQNIGWMTKPSLSAIFKFVFDLFEPIYFEQSNADAAAIILITLPIIAAAFLAFGFYFADWKNRNEIEKRNFKLLSIFFFTPLFSAFIISWISPYSIWGTRHLIIVFAPAAILTAFAVAKITVEFLRNAALISLLVLFAAAFALQATRREPKYIWCAWENLAANLDANQPTKIYVFEDLVAYHFWFAKRDAAENFQIIKINGIENLTEDKAYFLPRGFDQIRTTNQFEGDRFFIAFRDKSFDESAPPLRNLKAQGYRIGAPQSYEAQGLKAFLVEIKR